MVKHINDFKTYNSKTRSYKFNQNNVFLKNGDVVTSIQSEDNSIALTGLSNDCWFNDSQNIYYLQIKRFFKNNYISEWIAEAKFKDVENLINLDYDTNEQRNALFYREMLKKNYLMFGVNDINVLNYAVINSSNDFNRFDNIIFIKISRSNSRKSILSCFNAFMQEVDNITNCCIYSLHYFKTCNIVDKDNNILDNSNYLYEYETCYDFVGDYSNLIDNDILHIVMAEFGIKADEIDSEKYIGKYSTNKNLTITAKAV